MRCAIIAFALGVAFLQVQAALPHWMLLFTALGATAWLLRFAMACYWRTPAFAVYKMPFSIVCGFILGFSWAGLYAHYYLAQELPSAWEGRDVTLIGTIDSLPFQFEQGVRFNFAVERVDDADAAGLVLPNKLALAWYAGFGANSGAADPQAVGDVQPGERWRLTVRLRRPHGNANPDGFDYEVWLLEQGLRATGYVRPDQQGRAQNQRITGFVHGFGNYVETCRAWLRQRILRALPGKEYASVLVALVVGDQRGVAQADWKIFNRSGIGHLISISGLHITMIAGLAAGLAHALWRRSFFTKAELPNLLPAGKVAALTGAGVALMYVLLAGFGVPAQRTLYMLSVVAAALWMGRITSISQILCLALLLVLLLDPWAVLWPGFWLSFGAVATILYASVGRAGAGPVVVEEKAHPMMETRRPREPRLAAWRRELAAAVHAQYVVTLGLVPLTLLLFGQISLVSPLANAIAIPLISFVVTPLALLGSVLPAPLSNWLLLAGHSAVAALAQGLQWLGSRDSAVWAAPQPPWWIFMLAVLGTLWLLAPRGWPMRRLGWICCLPLLLNGPDRPASGQMRVIAFDVGQGMALLIETEHHRLLYDTGPYLSPESDGGSRVILPYLKARGIDAIDAMIVSHNDNDHSGGALGILRNLRVGWVATSLWPDSAIVRAAPIHMRCASGQRWNWDGVEFQVLHPTRASYDEEELKPNARSCTLKISVGKRSILLAGDIEAAQEAQLLERNGAGLQAAGLEAAGLQADVLLAPHHGSGTSSTSAFLAAVKPQLALFQLGYHNRYHHPKQQVWDRYEAMGIKRLRNDESGAIMLEFGATLEVVQYRTQHARYWYGR